MSADNEPSANVSLPGRAGVPASRATATTLMDSPLDTRPKRACLRLEALLRDQTQTLTLPARKLLRALAAARNAAGVDRRALVEDAALVLSELVDQGQLSDDSADALWLALAGCAQSEFWVSRAAAEAAIA